MLYRLLWWTLNSRITLQRKYNADYNWDEVLAKNEEQAKKILNRMSIILTIGTIKNIEGKLESLKDSASTFKYTDSPEYEDFKLFLQIAKGN